MKVRDAAPAFAAAMVLLAVEGRALACDCEMPGEPPAAVAAADVVVEAVLRDISTHENGEMHIALEVRRTFKGSVEPAIVIKRMNSSQCLDRQLDRKTLDRPHILYLEFRRGALWLEACSRSGPFDERPEDQQFLVPQNSELGEAPPRPLAGPEDNPLPTEVPPPTTGCGACALSLREAGLAWPTIIAAMGLLASVRGRSRADPAASRQRAVHRKSAGR